MKNIILNTQQLSITVLCGYIISLFVFVHDPTLVLISEFLFILFTGITFCNILLKKKLKTNGLYGVLFIFVLLMFIAYYWCIEESLLLSKNKTMIQLFVLFAFVHNSLESFRDIELCLKSIAIGGMIMCLYSTYHYGFAKILYSLSTSDRLGGVMNQANIFGYFCLITFTVLLYFAMLYKKYYLILIGTLPVIFIITTGSRKSLLLVIFGAMLLISLYSYYQGRIMSLIAIIIGIIIIASPFLVWLQTLDVFSRFDGMFNAVSGEGKVDHSLLVRQEMIRFGLEKFTQNPIVGYGTGHYAVLYFYEFGEYRPSHNGYIQLLVEFGLVGFCLYYSMYIYMIVKIWYITTKHRLVLGIVIVTILVLQLLTEFTTYTFYAKFTYIYLAIGASYIEFHRINNLES